MNDKLVVYGIKELGNTIKIIVGYIINFSDDTYTIKGNLFEFNQNLSNVEIKEKNMETICMNIFKTKEELKRFITEYYQNLIKTSNKNIDEISNYKFYDISITNDENVLDFDESKKEEKSEIFYRVKVMFGPSKGVYFDTFQECKEYIEREKWDILKTEPYIIQKIKKVEKKKSKYGEIVNYDSYKYLEKWDVYKPKFSNNIVWKNYYNQYINDERFNYIKLNGLEIPKELIDK